MPKTDVRLRESLLPAFAPCDAFGGRCSTMRWEPARGHIPRGFCGATGKLSDVRLVLVSAEPGDPHEHEIHEHRTPEEAFDSAYDYAFHCVQIGTDLYHRNIRRILNLCFPGESFDEQMHKTWLTDSVLCSARKEGGSIPASAARACRSGYLEAELRLFPNAVVAALGSKARERMAGLPFIAASAAAPPGCNYADALASWQAIADRVRATHV